MSFKKQHNELDSGSIQNVPHIIFQH